MESERYPWTTSKSKHRPLNRALLLLRIAAIIFVVATTSLWHWQHVYNVSTSFPPSFHNHSSLKDIYPWKEKPSISQNALLHINKFYSPTNSLLHKEKQNYTLPRIWHTLIYEYTNTYTVIYAYTHSSTFTQYNYTYMPLAH